VRAFVYDTGALLAAQRRTERFVTLHNQLAAERVRPIVPVVVLAQAWRGGPQHEISRMLKNCDILPDEEITGRSAGDACGRSGTADVVDAIVVATAVARHAVVVTSDPNDLRHLADSLHVKLQLFVV
jgi:predicted nucleic acid-binding protein